MSAAPRIYYTQTLIDYSTACSTGKGAVGHACMVYVVRKHHVVHHACSMFMHACTVCMYF